MRAQWAAQVTEVCNAVRAAGFAGTMVRDGAGAFGNAPLPENKRNRRGTSAADNGCWKIVTDTRSETVDGETTTKTVRVFANQYYLDGEKIRELALEDAVEDFVCQGELAEGEEYTEDDLPYVCLKVSATTNGGSAVLVGYATIADLQEAQNNFAYVVKPLYKFTHDGAIAVDFRNCPAMQMAEEV